AIYAELSPEQQVIVQHILLRLTQPGEGTEDTRRRAAMSELATRPAESEEVERVVNALVNARLLTTSGTVQESDRWVEVSHEALIRGWPQLRAWIENDRAGLRVHRRLTEAAQEWQRLRQDDGLLYRGAHLAEALEWRQRHDAELNENERAFLAAGVAFQEQEQQTREQRRRRLIWGLTTGLVIALGLSGLAFFQWRHAHQETQRAERNLIHAVDAIDTLG